MAEGDAVQGETARSPRERWGTCCPYDPECEHSLLDDDALAAWMDKPISDDHAHEVAGEFGYLR